MTDIRVGVIGVGYLGYFHAQKYAKMTGVKLVGMADIRKERAEEVAAEFSCRAYSDYHALLKDVDAVSVVVPTASHFEVASVCMGEGVDLLLEKPMTTTLSEADELIAMAERLGIILQIGHLERYNPAIIALEQYLTRPMFIESHRLSIYKERGADVDVVLDLMIHDIDIVLSIVPSELTTIHAVGVPVVTGRTDIANARLIFANGCTANVTVSRISRENMRRMRIFQPRTYISVDYATKEIGVVRMESQPGSNGIPETRAVNFSFAEDDALRSEIKAFVGCVRSRETPQVSGREGRRALGVAIEIISQINEHVKRNKKILDVI